MIDKIIDELSDSNQSLVNPLLKTKVIATRIGNIELLNWINKELNGYNSIQSNSDLPDYRNAKANSSCTLKVGYGIQENTPVPIAYLKDEGLRDFFIKFPLVDGVQTLETYTTNPKGDTLGKNLSVDFWKMVTSEFRKTGVNITVTNISVTTSISSITQTLSEIRSKFLDLMLAVETEFPNISDISSSTKEQKNELSDKITLILKQVNITNSGDGSSINTGNDNALNSASGDNIQQEINLTKEKSEQIEELISELKSAIADQNFEEKSDVELEIQRVENQLSKEEPKSTIVKQSLETIKSFLLSVSANVWTPPIIEGINNILMPIG
ncbi:hypothetical protein SAMN05444278_1231 [Psychroflexus salarius]|uniref:AbiTii domain-containing protein n=1 Tax=Psychroflexus salarius TaxID=1155689 RepID=A0A1M4YCE9_9FLAO|nr:hypothetical protein [Psychroflexus salarius]SHF03410.1 hypothetical protein SAMN05444278_1231 [Psychroflexus salarius]